MNLTKFAIDNRVVTYFALFLITVGGIASFLNLGQLEDPEFTVKTAVITTAYPGASPTEVELEVTDRIELALQEISEVDYLESFSSPGYSLIKVEIRAEHWSDQLPQIWDEMRRKIRDVESTLPPGAGRPSISDDFGDVFGLFLAVTGDGFTYAELEDYTDIIRKELSLVDGVARIDVWGEQQKVVYLDVLETQLSQLGLTEENIESTLRQQNMVVDAGRLDIDTRRLRIAVSGEFGSPTDIGDLTVRPTVLEEPGGLSVTSANPRTTELIRIRDIGRVEQAYLDPPVWLMRFNGEPAYGIAITNVSGVNVVHVGQAVIARLDDVMNELPVGIEVHKVHWQSDVIEQSVKGFFVNLVQAVLIVLVVLTLAMGWRMGVIIGVGLVLTILGTFIFMAIFGIDLQRMSLGALVIALGMMVDNAIVVADGYVVRINKGMEKVQAAMEAASQPALPLLGATVIAVMAFYPIFASEEAAGEYCRTLFTVVAISLLTSWILSVMVTPLQCMDMLHANAPVEGAEHDPHAAKPYRMFKGILIRAIRYRMFTVAGAVVLLAIAVAGFGNVKQLFFPDSSMPKFMVDYWAPEGTRIQQVAADLEKIEARLLEDERVEGVATFVGSGPPRFYLPVDPELPNPSYGQVIVNVHDFRDINDLLGELSDWAREHYTDALVPLRVYGVGPSNTWKLELRFSGPAVADSEILRGLAEQAVAILVSSPIADRAVQTDWRQRVLKVTPEYNQARARWASITREDVSRTSKRAFDGRPVGLYRDRDDLIPIVLRHQEYERQQVGNMDVLQVQPKLATHTIPMSQVIDGVTLGWEDPLIWRRDRRRTITVQGNAVLGETLPTLRSSLLDELNAIELPPGYSMEWGGEYEDTVDAQASLVPGVIPAVAIMLFIIVALFNALRPPLIIILTIPFALIGITAGLLATSTPFGFLALLGAMSLSGMMIKNAIVLLDQIDLDLAAGKTPYQAVVDSSLSRLRPVVLAAATTVLGVIPLLQDVFWVGMAVTIMAGLTFGTVLTMVLVPVFYTIFFRVKAPETSGKPAASIGG